MKLDKNTLRIDSGLSEPVVIRNKDLKESNFPSVWKIGGTERFELPTEETTVDLRLCTQEPKSSIEWEDGSGPFVHDCEEFWLVLEGKLKVTFEGEEWELEEGDLVYFPGTVPHSWYNPEDEKSKILMGYVKFEGEQPEKDYYEHLDPDTREKAFQKMREYLEENQELHIAAWTSEKNLEE